MLFTGHSQHKLDPKLRVQVPAKYRNLWDPVRDGSAWICVPWPAGHLRLFTETTFARLSEGAENTLTPGEAAADLEGVVYGFAERLEMDGDGRVLLPKRHLELTGLKAPGEVVLVGVRNRLEVWDAAAWNAAAEEKFRRLPELVARMEEQRRARGG